MNIYRNLRFVLAAIFVAGFSQQAFAIPMVILDGPRVAREIQGLDVLGTLYDVVFDNFTHGTFIGNPIGATAARDAINAALNTTTADLVRVLSTGVTVNNFGVQDTASTTVRGVSFFISMNWQPSSTTALLGPVAQFTPHVPPLYRNPLLSCSWASVLGGWPHRSN